MQSGLPLFKASNSLTMGVELELQLVDLQEFDLAMEADDLLRRLSEIKHPGEIKPEVTCSMIEVNSSIHGSYESLVHELYILRDLLVEESAKTHIGICGGGAHPFQRWHEQRIFPTERFANVSEQYGYLAKQFTVFGQHIHIACPNGDDALYLCHAMARYIPHFIVLSAASPFHQGIDTSFDCSRLTVISAFPLSGTPPWLQTWVEFEHYFEKMEKFELVKSMKDFYWDIRPKPEYGTIELRICDTPLTVGKAAQLAAYMQMLVAWLLDKRPPLSRDIYLTYLINRFRCARYGLDAMIVDPIQEKHLPIIEDIRATCQEIAVYAIKLGSLEALLQIQKLLDSRENDATWLRKRYSTFHSLKDVVKSQTQAWLKST